MSEGVPLRGWLLALAVFGLALLLRSIGWHEVFVGDADVALRFGDSLGHARRAQVTFEAFPRLLTFDPYLNHPAGAAVPSPPLYDWLLGAVARAFGSRELVFLRVLALASPLLGALAVLPVMAAARGLGGRVAGLLGGLLYAVMPAMILRSRVGDADHHAAVSLLGALWLAASLALLRAPGRGVGLGVAMTVLRAALVLTWGGSLAYLAAGDGALMLAALVFGRGAVLGVVGWSALGSALLVAPVVALLPPPTGGLWTTGALSWIQPLVVATTGLLSTLLFFAERRWPASGAPARIGRAIGVGAVLAAACLAIPGLRNALAGGLALSPLPGVRIAELQALLPISGASIADPTSMFGWLSWAVPFAPVLAWLGVRESQRRDGALVLVIWTATFGALAVQHVRFVTEFAAAGAVAFALALSAIGAWVARRGPPAMGPVLAFLLAGLLVLPATGRTVLAPFRDGWQALVAPESAEDRLLATPHGTLTHFLRAVRAATPETQGWLGDARPSYGVMVRPQIGHAVQALARRASPGSGYLHMAGTRGVVATDAFFGADRERVALQIALETGVPFVVTAELPGLMRGPSLEQQLHRHDGSRLRSRPALGHFRLRVESPERGRQLGELVGYTSTPGVVPYKLFELVEGALVAVPARPDELVTLTLDLESSAGRRFRWSTRDRSHGRGEVSLRVPYATSSEEGSRSATRALGPARVQVGGRSAEVEITEEAVRKGATIRVELTDPA